MSKDKKFHKLIEDQDKEKKNLMWRKIQNQIVDGESDVDIENYGEVAALSKKSIKKRILLISTTIYYRI